MSLSALGTGTLNFFDGTQWVPVGAAAEEFVSATGGTETDITVGADDYRVHTFTSSGNFVVTSPGYVQYLVIGGGGGCHNNRCGGGGAGGYRCSVPGELSGGTATAEPEFYVSAGTVAVVVGAGGGTAIGAAAWSVDRSGNDSSFGPIVSVGGGYNIDIGMPGTPGGSGAGGNSDTRAGGKGVTRQGFAGGTSRRMTVIYDAAGGGGGAGGAGAAGGNVAASGGGAGGTGIESSINGTPTFRAGGGGGGVDFRNASTTGGGAGGTGGGGAGSGGGASDTGGAGTANTGSGGGGGSMRSDATLRPGGPGGSGIVIVRYKLAP